MDSNDIFKDENLIFKYTREEAIEDGTLVLIGYIGKTSVVFTSNLFYDGYEDTTKRLDLVSKGIVLLKKPDLEDTDTMHLRVIEKDKIWVIHDGDGITFLKPEDY